MIQLKRKPSNLENFENEMKKQKYNDKTYKNYLDDFKFLLNLNEDNIKGGEIKHILLENAECDNYRFHIKYFKTTKKNECKFCDSLRQCDHVLIIEEYISKTNEEYEYGEESEYENSERMKIGNFCVEKIILLKELSNIIYKMKKIELSIDYFTNEIKQYDFGQMIADYIFNIKQYFELCDNITHKSIKIIASGNVKNVVV